MAGNHSCGEGGESLLTETMKNENPHSSPDKQANPQLVPVDESEDLMEEESSPEWSAPEVPPGDEELLVWDEVPENTHVSTTEENDESSDASELVSEGMDEADRELRMSAADQPDDEDLSDDEEAAAEYPITGILS